MSCLAKLPALLYKKRAKGGKILGLQEGKAMEPRRLNVPRIALRLAELNLTVESFTTDARLDRRTVQRLLSGKTQNPQYSTVKAIADFLELQPRDILLITGADTATDSSTPRAM